MKGLITSLMLSAPPPVRAQLSEALTLISGHDFPGRWRGLLPELCERLTAADPAVVNGVLETANSIFKRCAHLSCKPLSLTSALRQHRASASVSTEEGRARLTLLRLLRAERLLRAASEIAFLLPAGAPASTVSGRIVNSCGVPIIKT